MNRMLTVGEILNKYASLRQNKFKVKLSEGLASIGERAFEGREGLMPSGCRRHWRRLETWRLPGRPSGR